MCAKPQRVRRLRTSTFCVHERKSLIPNDLKRVMCDNRGMVQKRPFSGNTRGLGADADRSRVGEFTRVPACRARAQLRANRVYPRSSSQ